MFFRWKAASESWRSSSPAAWRVYSTLSGSSTKQTKTNNNKLLLTPPTPLQVHDQTPERRDYLQADQEHAAAKLTSSGPNVRRTTEQTFGFKIVVVLLLMFLLLCWKQDIKLFVDPRKLNLQLDFIFYSWSGLTDLTGLDQNFLFDWKCLEPPSRQPELWRTFRHHVCLFVVFWSTGLCRWGLQV